MGELGQEGKRKGPYQNLRHITKRKLAKEAMAKSELSYRTLAESIPIGISFSTLEGRVTEVNSAALKLFGYDSKDDFLKVPASTHYNDPKDREQFIELLKKGPVRDFEAPFRCKDGTVIWLSITSISQITEAGVNLFINSFRDITKRKQTEEELTRLSDALKISTDSIVISDVEGRIISVNEATMKMYGTRNNEDLIGKECLDIIAPKDRERALANMKETLEKGYVKGQQYHIVIKDGSEIPVEMNAVIMKDTNGKPVGFVGVTKDITERKKAEKTLRESEEKYSALVETSPNGIFISDADRFIYVNLRLCEITGFSKEELLNMPDPVGSLFTPEERDRVLGYARSRLSGGPAPTCYEARGIRKDGEVISLKLTVSSIVFSGKRVLQGNVEDITEGKRGKEALNSERGKLQALMDGLARTQIGINVVGIDHRVFFQNETLKERFGDLSGKLCYEEYMGLKEPCDFCPMTKEIGSKKVHSVELTAADGRSYELLSAQLPNSDGTVDKVIDIVKDITERKQAEEALRKSEERLHTIISNAPIVMWALDKEGIFTLSEGMGLRALGLGPGEVVGRSVFEVYHDVPKILEDNRRALAGESFASTLEVGELTYDSHYSPVHDEDGEVIGMIGVSTDITERKKAEDALAQERNTLRTLIDSMPDYIFVKDAESRFITTNATHLQTLGPRRVEDVIGKTDFDFFPRELAERYYVDDQNVIKSGQPLLNREEEVIDQTGTSKWFSTIKVPLRDNSGSVLGIVGISRDITERKRVQNELRKNERRLSQIVHGSSVATIVINDDHIITQWNKACENLTGIPADEVLGTRKQWSAFYPAERPIMADFVVNNAPEEVIARHYGDKYRKSQLIEGAYEVEDLFPHLGEKGKWLFFTVAPLRDIQGKIIGAIETLQDITQRKEAEEEIKHYSEHLEELVEERTRELKEAERMAAIGETTIMVGHDLRNPLQAIVNNIYLAKKKAASLHIPEEELKVKQALQKSLEMIRERVGYMNKIVLDLQDYSRPVKPKLYGTDMEKLVSDVLSTVTVPETVMVSTVTDDDFPELMIDRELMRRVLTNLITNAVQAMPKGGKLMIRLSTKNRDALISVQDTGVGIPEENLDKLFNPLFTTKSQGQGFGLPVCKRLIEAHGGSISVKSEEGKGSIFTVKISVKPSEV